MIHNVDYVKGLMRKRFEGTISPMESALLRAAHRMYEEEEWLLMTAEALEEMDGRMDDSLPDAPALDLAAIRKRADRKERRERQKRLRSWTVAAALLLAVIGWAVKHHWDIHYGPLERFGDCISITDTLIPATEFRGKVSSGGFHPVAIEPGVEGLIIRAGRLSVHRDSVGMLWIRELSDGGPPVAGDQPDIHIATGTGEQCGVHLPGGTVIRLNGLSALYYPSTPDTAAGIRINGEAYVQVPPQESGRQVTLKTVNTMVYSRQGSFVIHASDGTTSATLLDGQLSVLPGNGRRMEYASERADVISVTTNNAPDGHRQDMVLLTRHNDINRVLQWAQVTTEYRNVPLKEFIRREGTRFGIKFGNLACLPDGKRINAALCYRATVDDFLAAVGKEGLRVYVENGVYTFCDPATGKPWARGTATAALAGTENCDYCWQRH